MTALSIFCAVALCTQVRAANAYSDLPIGSPAPPPSAEQPVPPAEPGDTLALAADGPEMPVADSTTISDLPAPATTAASAETMEQAWSIATANHPLLQARQHEIAAADHELVRSRAEYYPNWSLAGGYTRRDQEPGFRLENPALPFGTAVFPTAQEEASSFRASVALPLYTSGQLSHGVAAAEANRGVADHRSVTTEMDLKLQVAAAYASVLRSQCDLDVARCRVASLEAHLREVSSLRDQRQARENDRLAASVASSNARYLEAQTANRLDVARSEYNRLLGRALTHPVQLTELTPPQLDGDLNDFTHRALAQRPELASLALQSKAICEQADAVRAGSKPRVDLFGEYAFEENRFQDPEGIAAVAVMVSWNAWDSGRNRHQADALTQESASVAMIRRDLESTIELEVRSAWLDHQEAQRRIGIAVEALAQAEENLRVSNQNYAAGFATNTEVLNAVTYRAESQRDYHHAIYDAVLAELRIRRAIGELP